MTASRSPHGKRLMGMANVRLVSFKLFSASSYTTIAPIPFRGVGLTQAP